MNQFWTNKSVDLWPRLLYNGVHNEDRFTHLQVQRASLGASVVCRPYPHSEVIPHARGLLLLASKQNYKALAFIHNHGRRGTSKPRADAMGAMSSGGFDNPESAGPGMCCTGDGVNDSVRVGCGAIPTTVKTDSKAARPIGPDGGARRGREVLTWNPKVESLRTVQRGEWLREEIRTQNNEAATPPPETPR